MQSARETWTDERLDDLSKRVDCGFEKIDRDIRGLRSVMKAGHHSLREDMNARFGEMNARFGQMDARFGRLERTIHWFGGGMFLAIAAAFLSGSG